MADNPEIGAGFVEPVFEAGFWTVRHRLYNSRINRQQNNSFCGTALQSMCEPLRRNTSFGKFAAPRFAQ